MAELTYLSEAEARTARRAHIDRGDAVSLLAFDATREVYTFDLVSEVDS